MRQTNHSLKFNTAPASRVNCNRKMFKVSLIIKVIVEKIRVPERRLIVCDMQSVRCRDKWFRLYFSYKRNTINCTIDAIMTIHCVKYGRICHFDKLIQFWGLMTHAGSIFYEKQWQCDLKNVLKEKKYLKFSNFF